MNTFRDKFLALVRLSNLAPSSHNCQPWMVTELAGDVWDISLHPDRKLKGLAAHWSEMLISLGGFVAILENLLIANDIPFESQFLSGNSENGDDFSYRISLGYSHQSEKLPKPNAEVLLSLIEQRYTDRGPHKKIDFTFEMGGLLNIKNVNSDLTVRLFEQTSFKDDVCSIVSELGWMEFTHPTSWKELYSFIDFNDAQGAVDKLGFNIQQLIGPAGSVKRKLYSAALHPAIMPVSHQLGLTRYICDQLNQCIRSSHGIVVITSKASLTALTSIDAGKKLCDLWLQLVSQGIVLHPLSILLQHEIIKDRFRQLLPSDEIPLFVARIGLPVVQQTSDSLMRYRRSIEKGVVACV